MWLVRHSIPQTSSQSSPLDGDRDMDNLPSGGEQKRDTPPNSVFRPVLEISLIYFVLIYMLVWIICLSNVSAITLIFFLFSRFTHLEGHFALTYRLRRLIRWFTQMVLPHRPFSLPVYVSHSEENIPSAAMIAPDITSLYELWWFHPLIVQDEYTTSTLSTAPLCDNDRYL